MRLAKKILKIIGLSILALLGLLFYVTKVLPLVFLVMPLILRPEVDAMITAIEAKGQPVSMVDLAGPAIPEAENAALLYADVFKRIEGPQASRDFDTFRRFASEEERAEDPAVGAEARVALVRNKEILVMLDKPSRPKCRFPVNWNVRPMDVKFPHVDRLTDLACFLYTNAVISAAEGDMKEAVHSLELGYRLSESLRDEPTMISQSTRQHIIGVSSAALREASARGNITETQAKRLFDVLQCIDLHDSLEIALTGERAMGIAFFGAMREDPWALSEPESPGSKDRSERPSGKRTSSFWRGLMYADERFYLRTMNRWVDLAHLPYREIETKHAAAVAEPKFPRYAIVSVMLLPTFRAAGRDTALSEVSGAQVFLAILVYKDRFGSYPERLDQLRARLGWKLPEDPFCGKDFVYRRQGTGFVLYSLGENLKDDGGRAHSPALDRCLTSEEAIAYDIVWQMDH